MKIFYLSSLLSIVAYVSAISECPEGGASAGVYGPEAGICLITCKNKGYGKGDYCIWKGDNSYCLTLTKGITEDNLDKLLQTSRVDVCKLMLFWTISIIQMKL
ncbi:unnamed protein product [Cunninghamella echinulata]